MFTECYEKIIKVIQVFYKFHEKILHMKCNHNYDNNKTAESFL